MGEESWQIRNFMIDMRHIKQISVVVVLCTCVWKLTVSKFGWFWKLGITEVYRIAHILCKNS
jgi:hypothetical protein